MQGSLSWDFFCPKWYLKTWIEKRLYLIVVICMHSVHSGTLSYCTVTLYEKKKNAIFSYLVGLFKDRKKMFADIRVIWYRTKKNWAVLCNAIFKGVLALNVNINLVKLNPSYYCFLFFLCLVPLMQFRDLVSTNSNSSWFIFKKKIFPWYFLVL